MKNIILLIAVIFSLPSRANQELNFVKELISEGDYHRALTVAKFEEFKTRQSAHGLDFQKQIIKIHILSQDFENFDTQIEKLIKNYPKHGYQAEVLQSEAFFMMGNYSQAYSLITESSASPEKKEYFRIFSHSPPTKDACQTDLCKQMQSIESEIHHPKDHKSPGLALGLGIIPGLGQFYAGQRASGIASFLLNGFFITTTLVAFNNNEDAFGIASAIVGTTFYASSIYAGYEATKRFNTNEINKGLKKLKDIDIKFDIFKMAFD